MTEKVNEIMDAAERRIRKAGYNGFSFREIANDVGIKSSSVHYYFPTKEKLASAVARRYTDRFITLLNTEMKNHSDITKVCNNAFRKAFLYDGDTCLCGVLSATSNVLPEEVRIEAKYFFTKLFETLSKYGLSKAQAMQIVATLEGIMLLSSVFSDASFFDKITF